MLGPVSFPWMPLDHAWICLSGVNMKVKTRMATNTKTRMRVKMGLGT